MKSLALPSALFSLSGWGGLLALVMNTVPTVMPRWLFFFLLTLAVTGTLMPPLAYLNQRFQGQPPATPGVVVRQATWFGLLAATTAWLQMGRVFSLSLFVLLGMSFALIELLLRMNERSQWKA